MTEVPEATEECPRYRIVAHDDGWATTLYMVVCEEGWRTSIVCERMYGWAADWLVNLIQGQPYAREPKQARLDGSQDGP